MAIVGISGSPFPGGNTDRLVQSLLEQSGCEHIFVNLSSLDFVPCRGCADLCAKTNICPLEDGLRPYFEPILEADALVLGSPVHSGTITAWMFSFLSRIWCFRHIKLLLKDKPLLLVMTGLFQSSEHGALHRFDETVRGWDHRMRHVGALFHATEIPPCYKCGVAKACRVGGLWDMVDHDEERLSEFEVTPDKFTRWEDCPRTVAEVERYAQVLGEAAKDVKVAKEMSPGGRTIAKP